MLRTKKLITALVSVGLAVCAMLPYALPAAAQSGDGGTAVSDGIPDVSEFEGKTIGNVTGSWFDSLLDEKYSDIKVEYFNGTPDAVMALKNGKIDVIVSDRPVAEQTVRSEPSLTIANGLVAPDSYGFIFPKNETGEKLQTQFNEYLHKISENGELEAIKKKRFDEEDATPVNIPENGENGVINFATTSLEPPFSYISEGRLTGYSMEMVEGFCKEYGYGMKISDIDISAVITGVAAGKYDMYAAATSITDERKQSVLFTDPVYEGGVVLIIKKSGADTGTLSDYAHKCVGVKEGSIYEQIAEELLPDAEKAEYKNNPDLVLALTQGKIDCFFANAASADVIMSETQGIFVVGGEKIPTEEYGFCFPKNDDADNVRLMREFNEFVNKITADGTLDEIYKIWTGADEAKKVVDLDGLSGENGDIDIAINSGQVPFAYIKDGKYAGYDVDIAVRFCREYGYSPDFSDMDFGTIVSAVGTGKCDIGMSLSKTPERMENINFSDTTFAGGVVLLAYSRSDAGQDNFFTQIAESFEKTFIREDRYQLILQGIGTTLLISICAAVAGTLLGFGVCMLRRSKNKVLSAIAAVYIRLLQGTPIVVFLMIMYYIVFGQSDIDPIWVAVIGFAMNFGAYAAEIMKTGIDAVDNGQIEAAKALGFTPVGTFIKVVMPQAARHFLPVYKGEIISLVKSTSIVGYIAVQDLTKMSDIIRSRTYEAFFPLIATAIIYFILAWLLTIVLGFIMKKVEPNYKKRTVKGVVLK